MSQSMQLLKRECGYYTIAIVVIIAFLALLASRSGTVTTANTVKTTSEEVAATEVFYAAEFALAEALIWLGSNDATATPQTGAGVPNGAGNNTPRSYATSFWFEESGGFTRVYARATGSDGSSATISQWLSAGNDVLNTDALKQPFGIGGSLSGVTGTGDVNAIGSSGTIPAGYYSLRVENGESTGGSYGNLNNGGEAIVDGEWSSGVSDIWDQYFSITRAEMQALAATSSQVTWVAANESYPSQGSGTLSSPAILILNDCAVNKKLNGGFTFIGIIFIDAGPCSMQGWSMSIKGSLAVNGDITKLTANTLFEAYYIEATDSAMSSGAGGLDAFDADAFGSTVVLPGTWTDTEVN